MKLAIGIPTLNRYDLLEPTLLLYLRDFPKTNIFVVDNGNQEIKAATENIKIIKNNKNVGVGASWNQLCTEIFKTSDYALILNDDIYLGKTKEEITKHFEKKNGIIRSTIDWCAFLMPKTMWQLIGKFDECFYPAYYEDKSYEYRMKLCGYIPIKTPHLNPVVYKASQTLEKSPEILEQSKKNKKLYIEMWGGEPEREKYKKPFNI